jgi:hypothetical protein
MMSRAANQIVFFCSIATLCKKDLLKVLTVAQTMQTVQKIGDEEIVEVYYLEAELMKQSYGELFGYFGAFHGGIGFKLK